MAGEFEATRDLYDEILRAWPYAQLSASAYAETLPRWKAYVMALIQLSDQVWNGGFSQYFYNTKGELLEVAIEGARAMGSEHAAQLLEEAATICLSASEENTGSAAGHPYLDFRATMAGLDKIDSEFAYISQELDERLKAFIDLCRQRDLQG